MQPPNPPGLGSLLSEFVHTSFGDTRLNRRLGIIVDAAAMNPSGSLPQQAGDDSALEGTYRFLSNPSVRAEEVFGSHFRCTAARAEAHGIVLVVHDSSEIEISGVQRSRTLGGRLSGGIRRGLLAHMSMCSSLSGEPLGLVNQEVFKRPDEVKPRTKKDGRRSQSESANDPDKESLRWFAGVERSEEVLYGMARVIHVMDREGDSYELETDFVEGNRQFVLRVCHDRRLEGASRKTGCPMLFETLSAQPLLLAEDREIPGRPVKGTVLDRRLARGAFGTPLGGIAHLEYRAATLEIWIGNGAVGHVPKSLKLNFVDVQEICLDDNPDPIHWRLVTSIPIDTPEQVLAIVDIYRRRWLIEEYFKALKTGCRLQKLQLESTKTWLVALAVYSVVAWRILLLRYLSRAEPEADATRVLTDTQIQVLKASSKKRNKPLADRPTVWEALLAVAALGGHIKNNGAPGWIVLYRGFEHLLIAEMGWIAAVNSMQNAAGT